MKINNIELAVEVALEVVRRLGLAEPNDWRVQEKEEGSGIFFLVTPDGRVYPEENIYYVMEEDIVDKMYFIKTRDALSEYYATYSVAHLLVYQEVWPLESGKMSEMAIRALWEGYF